MLFYFILLFGGELEIGVRSGKPGIQCELADDGVRVYGQTWGML